jgi:PAS domain S-box-containing protein
LQEWRRAREQNSPFALAKPCFLGKSIFVKRGVFAGLFRGRHSDAPSKHPADEPEHYRAALLQAINDVSADGILVVSADRQIISINARMREMWGIPPDVAASRSDELTLASVLHQLAEPDAFLARVQHLYDHPDERSWDEVLFKDGRVFERYSAPVIGPDQTRYGRVWFFRDVTARKEAEQMVTKLRQAFAAAIVHDLRAPIQTILLQSTRLLEASEASARESAARIQKQARELSRMTTDLLDVTTIDLRQLRLETEPLSVSSLVREIVDNFKPMLDSHAVVVEADEALPLVRADRQRLGQVLMNLLLNAVAYSPEGSPIDLEVRARDDGVMLSVHDRGIGIPAEDLPHIFERFFRSRQTRTAPKGHGLGLYVAHAFVEAHGGRIEVESLPSGGSTFRVWLPVGGAASGQ